MEYNEILLKIIYKQYPKTLLFKWSEPKERLQYTHCDTEIYCENCSKSLSPMAFTALVNGTTLEALQSGVTFKSRHTAF